MAFWLVILGLLRRREVAAVVVLCSTVAASLAYALVPVHYTSSATLVLTTSPTNQASTAADANAQPAINPLLNFNEGLRTAAAILVQSLNTKESVERLDADGGQTSVTISVSGGAQQLGVNGPFLYISGDSTASPAAATTAVGRAKDLAGMVLEQRQQELKAPPTQLIGLLYVVPPTAPELDRSAPIQAAVVGLVLTLAVSLGTCYLVDTVRENRRRLHAAATTSSDTATEAASTPEGARPPAGRAHPAATPALPGTVGPAAGDPAPISRRRVPSPFPRRTAVPAGSAGDANAARGSVDSDTDRFASKPTEQVGQLAAVAALAAGLSPDGAATNSAATNGRA